MSVFGRKLIKWYEKNKRDLPWRETSEPYKIWLSEVILQQTRVDQGLSYYHKFLHLFPTVKHLSKAEEDKVLKAWQGLGYYSRARNLHHTAHLIVSEHSGKFPESFDQLIRLKGIGPYTAAAIASFCFGEKKPVIDGNVIRVLSRVFGIEQAADTKEGKAQIAKIADENILASDPATYNQAIMELGALVCTPKSPDCQSCPVKSECFALARNLVSDLPVKKKKTVVKQIMLFYFHIVDGHSTYIRKRGYNGIWKGLYEFPSIEKENELHTDEVIAEFARESSVMESEFVLEKKEEFTHILTHRKIKAVFFRLKMKTGHRLIARRDWIKIKSNEIDNYGVPRLIDKYLSQG